MNYCSMTCGYCMHTADLDDFTSTKFFGALPPGQFQCPKCGTAIKLQSTGPIRVCHAENGDMLAFREKVQVVLNGRRF